MHRRDQDRTGESIVGDILTAVGLRSCFHDLFQIYGIFSLDDLSIVNAVFVQELEQMIRSNGFPGAADFTKSNDQLKFLGRLVNEEMLSQFKFAPLDRIKMIEKLPEALQKFKVKPNKSTKPIFKRKKKYHPKSCSSSTGFVDESTNDSSSGCKSSDESKYTKRTIESIAVLNCKAKQFAAIAVTKINNFWKVTKGFTNAKITLDDITTSIIDGRIGMAAKCPFCKTFFKLNMVEARSFGLLNYKKHAEKHVFEESSGSSKILSSKNQKPSVVTKEEVEGSEDESIESAQESQNEHKESEYFEAFEIVEIPCEADRLEDRKSFELTSKKIVRKI